MEDQSHHTAQEEVALSHERSSLASSEVGVGKHMVRSHVKLILI